MATLPTAEQTAREILSIFVGHFNSRPGHVLRVNNFLTIWHNRGLHAEDFNPGMVYAAQQEWIEILEGGVSFRLTEAGFAQA